MIDSLLEIRLQTEEKHPEVDFHRMKDMEVVVAISGEEIDSVQGRGIFQVVLVLRSGSMICLRRLTRVHPERMKRIRLPKWNHSWVLRAQAITFFKTHFFFFCVRKVCLSVYDCNSFVVVE